jgi:hypothetical protein
MKRLLRRFPGLRVMMHQQLGIKIDQISGNGTSCALFTTHLGSREPAQGARYKGVLGTKRWQEGEVADAVEFPARLTDFVK